MSTILSNMALMMCSNPTLSWDLGRFIEKTATTIQQWAVHITTLIGAIMLIAAIYQIASGLISHGKKQTNWVVAILLLIIGGALIAANGWEFVKTVSSGGQKTIKDLGETIVIEELSPNGVPQLPFIE